MERHPMLMDQKNLSSQYNFIENINIFLKRKNPKIHLVLQKVQNNENNPKEQKQSKVIKNKIKI